jgi:NADH-quinone oxidoreductase subunit N
LKPDITSVQLQSILDSVKDFYPETGLICLFLILILVDLIFKKKAETILPYLTVVGLLVTFCLVLQQNVETSNPQPKFLFFKFLHLNQYEVLFKLLFHVSSLLLVWLVIISPFSKKHPGLIRGEFYSILIAMLLGLHLMVMASNLLMIYLSLEIVSICSYLLTTFSFDKRGSEAGVKYILFGAFSSGLMLYGMSWFYGFTGSLQFYEPEFLTNLELVNTWMVTGAAILILSGILFKIASVPFHLWAPDVYEAAPTPVVAFFSIAPKAAGIGLLINFIYPFYHNVPDLSPVNWKLILGIIAIATLTIGNLAALGQNNVKRLLAYSSIAHVGFILIAVLGFSHFAIWTVLFYLAIYLVMNFAAFSLVEFISDEIKSEDVRNFKGLGSKLPLIGIIFVIIMVSLTGLPPTAGFNAKFLAFSAIWEAYQESGDRILLWVFIVGLLNTVIALFYYLKIPYFMFFKKAENEEQIKLNASIKVFSMLMTLPMLVFFFKPDWLMDYLQKIILNF